jgi:hypothetical protein
MLDVENANSAKMGYKSKSDIEMVLFFMITCIMCMIIAIDSVQVRIKTLQAGMGSIPPADFQDR